MSDKTAAAPASATGAQPDLIQTGIELRYFTPQLAEIISQRHQELKRSGVNVSIGQVLLERKILTSTQLKQLIEEVEYRRQRYLKLHPSEGKAQLNKKFGQYELIEVLSESGRCRVVKARDTLMNRLAVLKVLPSHLASNKQWLERFMREIQVVGQLSHPNIVTAYGAGEVEGAPYMAMEFVDGMSIGDRLDREGNLPEKTAWEIGREVAKALAYAAESGILHRDIKPDNMLCGRDGKVKICDMGLAKPMQDDTSLTAAGTTVGTPFYISPEQARGTKELDGRADIYSLGCSVFHMLTGSVPFMAETMTDVMVAHTKAARPDPRDILPEITEGSARLVRRMMAIDPEDRPESAAQLVTEIEALLPQLPEPEAAVRPLQKVASSPTGAAGMSGRNRAVVHDNTGRPGLITRFLDWVVRIFN